MSRATRALVACLLLFGVAVLLATRGEKPNTTSADQVAASDLPYVVFAPMVVKEATASVGTYPPSSPTPTATFTPAPPTVTATPTATFTPTPTATPTPTPAAPEPVYIRQNHSSYYSITGSFWIVGEVVNALPGPVQYVRISARYYSSSGTLLATDFGYADVDIIPPGGDSPFSVLLIDPPPGIAYYTLHVSSFQYPSYDPPPTGLVGQITNTYYTAWGTRHDVGIITNTSDNTYEYVKALMAYYDSSGTVLRVDFTYCDPDVLAPGASCVFDLFITDADTLPIASTKLWVDADWP